MPDQTHKEPDNADETNSPNKEKATWLSHSFLIILFFLVQSAEIFMKMPPKFTKYAFQSVKSMLY